VRNDNAWRQLWEFLGYPEGAEEPRFRTIRARRARQAEMEAYLLPYLAKFTMQELFDGLQPHRILVGMALDIPHLIDNVHLNARDFFAQAEHPVAGLMGCAAVLIALHHRHRTGQGQFIDLALQEPSICFIGEQVLASRDVRHRGHNVLLPRPGSAREPEAQDYSKGVMQNGRISVSGDF
jgi:crotonobetainyl-CoA:carnitine CoA-transferase CaiB-like acyl-CoA transferase